ncbi:MAG: hypothetical protein FWG63_00865 [Defluviitaleaceae bacterium]|nr:hypothetical protein [Defluviitaleaceae bacterium]
MNTIENKNVLKPIVDTMWEVEEGTTDFAPFMTIHCLADPGLFCDTEVPRCGCAQPCRCCNC